jgi:hypothetical protein
MRTKSKLIGRVEWVKGKGGDEDGGKTEET